MRTHIHIFESLQLEGSYVGDLLYSDVSKLANCYGDHIPQFLSWEERQLGTE